MINKFSKVLFPFIFSLSLSQLVFPITGSADEQTQPRAVFSAVFWDKYQSKSFSYAPWGNVDDDNATMVSISVGSSSLSKQFVFYGTEKIEFYEKRRPREWEIEEGQNAEEEPVKKLAAEFEIPRLDKGIQEYVLLFINQKTSGLWKVYPIPFLKEEIPLGSYKFISQSRSALYILFGKEKIELPPGKSKVYPAVLEDGKRGMPLSVMIQKNGRYIEVFKQKFGHSSKMRGIFFLGLSGDKLSLKRVTEFDQPLTSATGYGLPPRKKGEDLEGESELETSE